MEPITLCGAVIVAIGLWVELEPGVKAVVRVMCKSRLFIEIISQSTAPKPASVGRMPICLAKAYRY